MIAQRLENNYLLLQTNCKLTGLPRRSRSRDDEWNSLKKHAIPLKKLVYFGHLQIPSGGADLTATAADSGTGGGRGGRGCARVAPGATRAAGFRDCPGLPPPICGRARAEGPHLN